MAPLDPPPPCLEVPDGEGLGGKVPDHDALGPHQLGDAQGAGVVGMGRDFSDSSRSSRVGALTRDSRVIAKTGHRGIILLSRYRLNGVLLNGHVQ